MGVIDFMNQIPSGIYSLLGVAMAAVINEIRDWYTNRDRLYCALQTDTPYEDWSYENTTKTGPSGYVIELYNCGKNPLIIDGGRLVWKNHFIDAVLSGPITILPYHSDKCILSKQDYEVLRGWLKKGPSINTVSLLVNTVDGKMIKGDLNISIIAFQFLGRR